MFGIMCYGSKINVVLLNPSIESEIKIFQISKKDTVEIKRSVDSAYKLNSSFPHLLIKNKLRVYDLGQAPATAKSIVIKLVPDEQSDCYVVHKIVNDIIQTDMKKAKSCNEFSEISFYDTFNPVIKKHPAITIKRKD